MTNKKPVVPIGMKRSKEYLYMALRAVGVPQSEAWALLNPENTAKENTQRRNAQYFEAKEKTQFAGQLVEKELQYKYGKIHYRDAKEVKIRDKETMILEINEKLDSALLDNKQELDYRKLLSELLHMKKEEESEDTTEKAPTIYLPDKHKIIQACKNMHIAPEEFISHLI